MFKLLLDTCVWLDIAKDHQQKPTVLTVLERIGHEIESGCFVTVTPTTIRIRRLPIKKG